MLDLLPLFLQYIFPLFPSFFFFALILTQNIIFL